MHHEELMPTVAEATTNKDNREDWSKLPGKEKSRLIRKTKSVERGFLKTEGFVNQLFKVYYADGESHNGKLRRYIATLNEEAKNKVASEPEDAVIVNSGIVGFDGATA